MSLLEKINNINENLGVELALHKAICNQNEKEIEFLIDTDDLEKKENAYGLTPLHLAVLLQDEKTSMKLLKKRPALAIQQDLAGWTPWHFAVLLGQMKLMNEFETLKEDNCFKEGIKTNLGSSVEDFINFYSAQQDPTDCFYFQNELQEIIKGDLSDFKQITDSHLIFNHVVQKEVLLSLRGSNAFKMEETFLPFVKKMTERYKTFKGKPYDHLYLGHVNSNVGWGTYALKTIPQGTIIWEFYGEIISREEYNCIPYSEFKVKYAVPIDTYVIDGRFKRNLASMTNCGFPNAYPFFSYLDDGLPHYLLIALENINAGEQICYDYGFDHPCKEQGYQELRPDTLSHFLSLHQAESWLDELEKAKKIVDLSHDPIDLLHFLFWQTKIAYIIRTPTLLFKLLLKGEINIETIKKYLENQQFLDLIQMHEENLYRQKKWIQQLDWITIRNDPSLNNFILDLCSKHHQFTLIFLMNWLNENQEFNWIRKDDISAFCQNYDEAHNFLILLFTQHNTNRKETLEKIRQKFQEMPEFIKMSAWKLFSEQLRN
jgi:hypothetical protein